MPYKYRTVSEIVNPGTSFSYVNFREEPYYVYDPKDSEDWANFGKSCQDITGSKWGGVVLAFGILAAMYVPAIWIFFL